LINISTGMKIESVHSYSIMEKIGEGNYAIVYKAKHEELGRIAALKFLKKGTEAISELKKEGWVQGKMNHPNIVSVYGIDEDLGFMAIEYLPSSLEKKYIEEKKTPSLDETLKIISDCLKALDHAHSLTIVHGDIKPGNILLDSNGNAKISDFGVSRLLIMDPAMDEGSARWAAPEVLYKWEKEGIWAPDYQADLFSLGVVGYYLLTGNHPFSDPTGLKEPNEIIQNGDYIPPSPYRDGEKIPQQLVDVIMKLIDRNTRYRYAKSYDALVDLGESLELLTYTRQGFPGLPDNISNAISKVIEGYNSLNDEYKLFNDFVEQKLIKLGFEAELWKSGRIHVGTEDIEPKGIAIFRDLRYGGFCTLMVKLSDFWDTAAKYHEVGREIARNGKEITRVFIIQDIESLNNENLLKHISADENSGIKTRIVLSDDIPDRNAIKDFGIWDNDVLCIVEKDMMKGGAVGCDFIFSEAAIDNAKNWKRTLLNYSHPSQKVLYDRVSGFIMNKPELKNLFKSAPIMRKLSDKYCKGSYVDNESCGWYHGSWQYLRLLDVVSTPDWHGDFYISNIYNYFYKRKRINVLICGLADYSMFSHLLDGCKNADVIPNITIFDLCQTPLEICKWYANNFAKGIKLDLVRGDAIEYHFRSNYYDLIVTDAFITRFPRSEQKKVISNWYQTLKSNGTILTTIRLRNDEGRNPVKFSEREIEYFKNRVWKLAIEKAGFILTEFADENMKRIAEEYASRMISYPFRSESDIKHIFNDFDSNINIYKTKGELNPTDYAQIICNKK